MKASNSKTLWKRETTANLGQTQFDQVVNALTAFVDATPNGRLDDVLETLQQNNVDTSGKTRELLTAVENVLVSVKLDFVESQSGVNEVLRDVTVFFLDTKTTTALDQDTSRLDELLERLDFVASGGTDDEVPKSPRNKAQERPATVIPTLPVERPQKFEDPIRMQQFERLRSLNTVLSISDNVSKDNEGKNRLQLEQLNLADYFLRDAERELTLELSSLASKLVRDISHALSEKTDRSIDFVDFDATGGVMYRSLAEVLRRKLGDLALIIGEELLHTPDAKKLHIELRACDSMITGTLTFVGLRTAFDLIQQRMEELSLTLLDVPIHPQSTDNQEALRKTAKTRKERIAIGLVELLRFVERTHGRFGVTTGDDDQLLVTFELPLCTRVLLTFPITVGSDAFLLEAHFVTAILNSSKVQWDELRTNVEYSGRSYQHCVIADHILPSKSNTEALTWILLLDTTMSKLALEVETIGEPELQVSSPSISTINLGHKLLGGNKLKLLVDPMVLCPKGISRSEILATNKLATHILCFNVSQPLVDKIRRCIDIQRVLVRHTTTIANTLSQLQEFRPSLLVIEDQADTFRAVDSVRRIAGTVRALNLRVLLLVDGEAKPIKLTDHISSNVTFLPRSADFAEFKNVFDVELGFRESAVESKLD